MAKKVSIRWSLMRSFIALTAALSVLLLISTLIIGHRAATRASRSYIRQAAERAEDAVGQFIKPALTMLATSKRAFESGLIDPDDHVEMNRFFVAFMEQVPQVTSINTGDADGNGYLILKDGPTWWNRLVSPARLGVGKLRWIQWDRRLSKIDERLDQADYDPCLRPWYQGAVNLQPPEEVFWTPPYTFKTTRDPGVTVSTVVRPPGGKPFVLAFDAMLKDVSAYTTQRRPSPTGKLLIVLDDGRVTGLPVDPRFADEEARKPFLLQPVEKMEIDEITAALHQWRQRGKPNDEIFKIDVGGHTWWCSFHRLPFRPDQPSWICSVVPEAIGG